MPRALSIAARPVSSTCSSARPCDMCVQIVYQCTSCCSVACYAHFVKSANGSVCACPANAAVAHFPHSRVDTVSTAVISCATRFSHASACSCDLRLLRQPYLLPPPVSVAYELHMCKVTNSVSGTYASPSPSAISPGILHDRLARNRPDAHTVSAAAHLVLHQPNSDAHVSSDRGSSLHLTCGHSNILCFFQGLNGSKMTLFGLVWSPGPTAAPPHTLVCLTSQQRNHNHTPRWSKTRV
jgi:hypothetical protein